MVSYDSEMLISKGAKSSPVNLSLGTVTMTKRIIPAPITSPRIKSIAGQGLKAPSTLTTAQVRALAASVEAHIEPRHKSK